MGNSSSKKSLKKSKNRNERYSFHDLHDYETKGEYDEREHLSIIILKEIFEGNFSSPIQDILSNPNAKILDVGCGSGFWLTDMSSDYPKPSYVGIDVAPTFPTSTIPNNIKFFQFDFLDGLPFEDNTFDFIHLHFLICEFTGSQWENLVYKEVARLLKPGGWLEVSDPEIGAKNGGPTIKQFDLAVHDNLKSNNLDPCVTQRHHSFIKSVPTFSSSTVYHEKRFMRLGSNGGKIGKISAQYMRDMCKNTYMGPIGQKMNIKREDIEPNLDLIESEFETYHTYYCIHRHYVRKPYPIE